MAEPRHVDESFVNEEVGFEESDVNIRLIFGSIVGLILLTIFSMWLSFWIWGSLDTQSVESHPTPLPLIELRPTPPPPRLQPNPIDRTTAEEDMAAMRERENAILSSYGWVDESNGIVRIPVERAIDLLSEDPTLDEPAR